jgi:hypothetical protein
MGNKEIKKVFNYLEENRGLLTSSQFEFIKSLKKYFKWKKGLTTRQIECLVSLKENILIPEEALTVER